MRSNYIRVALTTLTLTLLAGAGCATDDEGDGDGLWGPVDGKADGMYGGQVGIYGPIAFDQSKRFRFTGSRAAPAFRFDAKQGDVVSSLATISNKAPPWLLIIDEEMYIHGQSHLSGLDTLPDGRMTNLVTAEIPHDGEYFLVMSSTWTRNRVKGATIVVDLVREAEGDDATCEPVTCELLCQDGWQVDANGCEVCECN